MQVAQKAKKGLALESSNMWIFQDSLAFFLSLDSKSQVTSLLSQMRGNNSEYGFQRKLELIGLNEFTKG